MNSTINEKKGRCVIRPHKKNHKQIEQIRLFSLI